ncbi:MAG: transposase [Candidatus Korobacteraceae bacterium]
MDSSTVAKVEHRKRQRRSIAEKRRIVELAMQPGASVARVAREHGVNANMVHYWRNLYRQGRLGEKLTDSTRLLPVRVSESAGSPGVESVTKLSPTPALLPASAAGSIYIEFAKIHLRIESGADAALVRVVLESLPR